MTRLVPDQFKDGHRLPLRLELQLDAYAAPVFVIVDADHLDVAYTGESLADMRAYVDDANRDLTHYGANRGITITNCRNLSIPERLVDTHPCDRMPAVLGIAFECLAWGIDTDWITAEIRDDLRHYGVSDQTGEPKPALVRRWWRWRMEEDAALVRAGIRKAAKTHLSVVR